MCKDTGTVLKSESDFSRLLKSTKNLYLYSTQSLLDFFFKLLGTQLLGALFSWLTTSILTDCIHDDIFAANYDQK